MNDGGEQVALVTFEGIDGCGKSTQIEMLKTYLKKKNVEFSVFREPGGTSIGEQIRQILLNRDNTDMSAKTEFLLYAASRAQLVEKEVKPRLERGEFVILDRYIDSSVAYQGFGRKLGKRMVVLINEFATEVLYPDLTFYLEIDEETFKKRVRSSGDRMESEGWEFMERVIKGYEFLSKSRRFVKIDSRLSQDRIFNYIIREIESHFSF